MDAIQVEERSPMTLQERADLILAFARILFANGQSTDQTLSSAKRMSRALNLHADIAASWGELKLVSEDGNERIASVVPADPTDVAMVRVAAATRAMDDISNGSVPIALAKDAA